MSGVWRAYLDAQPWNGGKRLFLVVVQRDGGRSTRYAVAPPTLVAMAEGERYDTATLAETRDEVQDSVGDVTGFLQAIADLAWENGIRPAALEDQRNELKATRYHLEDMRKIAKVPGAA